MNNTLNYKSKNHLFIVSLGGKIKNANIELHDFRWVVGNTINETFDQLRLQWIGDAYGLHIDSYMKVQFIDGYKIELEEWFNNKKVTATTNEPDNRLWFINLGFYNPQNLLEEHKDDQ